MAYDQELAQCEKDYREISEAYNATCVVAEQQRAEIERLRAALGAARAALTADTIGTYNMDDPEWYEQVRKAVAQIDAALGNEQKGDPCP